MASNQRQKMPEVSRGILQKVDSNFLRSNELEGENYQDAIGKDAREARVSSNLHSKVSSST